jgi:hypothetical protein
VSAGKDFGSSPQTPPDRQKINIPSAAQFHGWGSSRPGPVADPAIEAALVATWSKGIEEAENVFTHFRKATMTGRYDLPITPMARLPRDPAEKPFVPRRLERFPAAAVHYGEVSAVGLDGRDLECTVDERNPGAVR